MPKKPVAWRMHSSSLKQAQLIEHPTTTSTELVFAEQVQLFVQRHLVKLGRSPAYRRDQVRRVITMARLGFPWEQFWTRASRIDAEDLVADWMVEMEDLGKTDVALDNYSKLLNICGKAAGIEGFHLKKRAPRKIQFIALTQDQINHVLDNYRHVETMGQIRNLAIFVVSLLLDARRSEPTNLLLDHLDPDGRRVFVRRAKNKVAQWEPVKDDIWPYIQAWLDVRPQPTGNPRALFTSFRRPYKPLNSAGVYKALSSMGKQLGVKLNSTVTRHTSQKRLAQAGVSLPTRRWKAGWTNDAMAAVYDEQGFDEAAEEIHAKAPGLREDPRAISEACPTCQRPWTTEIRGVPEL